jgi:signal transduction histidine kinase/ligand-binding sensor domain-containing protein
VPGEPLSRRREPGGPRVVRWVRGAGWLWLLVWLAAGAQAVPPTPWYARTWQTDEGLPDNAVVGMAQTPDGFLWVATQGGLVRFDGVQFRDFAPVTEIGVPSGLLHGLTVDRRGRLWVAKDGGVLACVDRGVVTSIRLRQGSANARAVTPVEDADGALWAAYPNQGDRVVRIRDGEWRSLGSAEGLPVGGFIQLTADEGGQIWCGASDRLGVFREARFLELARVPGLQGLAKARTGGLWLCASNRVLRFTESEGIRLVGELPAGRPELSPAVLLEDRAGRLWVGTGQQGLFVWEADTFQPVPVSHREILSLAEDREGSLWVGTRGGGLNRLRPRLVETQEIGSGLAFEAVRSVCQDRDGTLWAVARSGIVARQRGTDWKVLGQADGWPGDEAMSVVAHPDGGVWIGTHYQGVLHWRDRVVATVTTNQGLVGNFARSLLATPNGDLWIGTASADGLHRLRNGELRRFALPAGSGLVRALAWGSEGVVWAGTAGGSLLEVKGETLTELTAGSVPRLQTIRCLHATPEGALWIGYGGTGLGRWKAGRFDLFRAGQGISDDYLSQVSADGRGRLWFAGNKGIFFVREGEFDELLAGRRERVRPFVFGRDDGLPALQASREAWPGMVLAKDGQLWISMQTGLALVHPEAVERLAAPPVVIEGVLADGRLVAAYEPVEASFPTQAPGTSRLTSMRDPGATLSVGPGHEQLAIEFTALGLASPRNVAVRFRLEGLETDWVEAGSRRIAYYSHVPPGTYRFRATTGDPDGNWEESGTGFNLEVRPRYWQAWWFRLAAGVTGLLLVVGGVRFLALRSLLRRVQLARQQSAVERERTRIAKDIHDDLGASLTEITLLSELAQGEGGSPEETRSDLQRIAERTRQLTRSLDATVWAVNPRNDTLESLVTYLCNHAEDYLKSAGIRCRLEVPARVPVQPVTAALRHTVFLFLKEALHNVVKHAGATEVVLTLELPPGRLRLVLTDNGRGFVPGAGLEPSAGRRSRGGEGLGNLRRRAEEVGAQFELRSTPGAGTRVQLEVGLGLE